MARKISRLADNAPVDSVARYATSVISGAIVAGPHVRNACRRHLADLKSGPGRGLVWDLKAATRAIDFFSVVLRLNGGQYEGLPFNLDPSQAFAVGSIFGWKRADGTRRFRRAYLEIAKGNGKTPIAAGIGHYCLVADGEARAEIYAAAADKDQAMVLFRDAVAMREQSPALVKRLTTSGGNPVWNLADLGTGSFFRPISKEKRKQGSGPRPHCALCDEVHEHPDRQIIETLERGFKWRRQPLLVMTTNSGSNRNSVCWEEHQHAVRVAAGTMTPDDEFTFVGEPIDDETFSYVCALDKDEDPLEDEACWPKANPLLDVTVKRDYLAAVVRQAKSIPGRMNGILRLHFCQWTDAEEAWMSRQALEAVLDDFDPDEYSGEPAVLALDLSGSQDLTALAVMVRTGFVDVPREDGMARLPTFAAWVEAWTPADTIAERVLRDQSPYDVWMQQGWLNAVPGRKIRQDVVAARVAELDQELEVECLVYDRYAYARFEDELDALGVTLTQIEHPQGGMRRAKVSDERKEDARRIGDDPPEGLWMPGSVDAIETLILERRIRLRRSPLLISAMMSAAIEHDPFDNRWFSKRRAVNRIDALVSLTMAAGQATQTAVAIGSVYEERGLLVV
jgi:phage terminase large subunit-like protein